MREIFSNISACIVFALYVYVILSIIAVILLENRNPSKSLVWVLVLVFLPIVGVVLYAFIGQNFRRERIISKKSLHRLSTYPYMTEGEFERKVLEGVPSAYRRTIRLLQCNAEANLFVQNKIQLFVRGDEAFEAMFADIALAKQHVHVEFYIVENDALGLRLRDLLVQKAQEGVRVRFIYDYLGGFSLNKSYLEPLRKAGVYVQAFLPAIPYIGLSKVNYRNHRKLLIVDGRVGYTGGMNVAERYVKGNHLGLWRDTQIRFEGVAVMGLQNAFLIDWYFVDRKLITDSKYYPAPTYFEGVNNLVQVVSSGPDTDHENVMQGMVSLISNAQRYVYIHTPYFLPTESVLSALKIASLSGVDIRIMIPEQSDTTFAQMATRSYIKEMLEVGVKIYFYRDAFLHSKAVVVDDSVSTVGTSNMDFRSYEQNFEINAFVYDAVCAVQLREAFERDMQQSVEVTLEQWRGRKRSERLKDSFARLFSPLM